jgi:hypothetical protein
MIAGSNTTFWPESTLTSAMSETPSVGATSSLHPNAAIAL